MSREFNKEPQPPAPYKNVMHDRRIVRGSNYNQGNLMPWNPYFAYAGLLSGKDQEPTIKEAEARRRQLLRKRCLTRNQRNVLGTPPPIAGRRHENIQTEKYLEELFDRPPEFDANTQTDLFLQRPPSPPYIPAKVGVDQATQIENGELFNFDVETEPIVDTMVGHSLQQCLMESLHEQEIAELKAKQEEYLTRREVELAELRRLEAEEIRLQAEKERRLRQDDISKELDAKIQEEVTAAKLLQGHIASILPEVLQSLEPETDAAHKEDLEKKICPWLSQEVAEEVGKIIDSREILTEIIKEIIIQRATVYAGYSEEDEPNDEEGENEENDESFIREEFERIISLSAVKQENRTRKNLSTIKEELIKEERAVLNQENIRNNDQKWLSAGADILTEEQINSTQETEIDDNIVRAELDRIISQASFHEEEHLVEDERKEIIRNVKPDTDEKFVRNEFERMISLAENAEKEENEIKKLTTWINGETGDDADDELDNDEKIARHEVERIILEANLNSSNQLQKDGDPNSLKEEKDENVFYIS